MFQIKISSSFNFWQQMHLIYALFLLICGSLSFPSAGFLLNRNYLRYNVLIIQMKRTLWFKLKVKRVCQVTSSWFSTRTLETGIRNNKIMEKWREDQDVNIRIPKENHHQGEMTTETLFLIKIILTLPRVKTFSQNLFNRIIIDWDKLYKMKKYCFDFLFSFIFTLHWMKKEIKFLILLLLYDYSKG